MVGFLSYQLTFNVSECAENGPRTVSSLLNVVTFSGFVNLRVKLLLSTSVAVLTIIAGFTVSRFTPFFTMLYARAWCRSTMCKSLNSRNLLCEFKFKLPVLIFSGAASFVLTVVVLWTCVTLSAEPRGPFAWLCLVVGQDIVCVLPLWIFIHQIAFLVQYIGSVHGFTASFGRLHGLQLFDVVHWRPLIVDAVGECTVMTIFDAIPTCICIVNAHACFVVA